RDESPVQVQADDLRPQVLERREGLVRVGERLDRVVDPHEHAACRLGLVGLDGRGEAAENARYQGDACFSKRQVAPSRGSATFSGAPPRVGSRVPNPIPAWLWGYRADGLVDRPAAAPRRG